MLCVRRASSLSVARDSLPSFSDNAFGRIFQTELPDNQNLTVESCVASCNSQNFTLAGMEFSGTGGGPLISPHLPLTFLQSSASAATT